MACFAAPAATAVILTALKKKIPSRYHISWLLALLWGGVLWLIPEHIYHGEVILYPPFFTAGLTEIIPEILKVGIPMTLGAILIWLALLTTERYLKTMKLRPNLIGLMIIGALMMVLVDEIFAIL